MKMIKMSDENSSNNITDIIRDIETGLFSVDEITSKYSLTKYKYYKLLKEAGIKNDYTKNKDTKFRLLLKQSGTNPNQSFNLEEFKEDCEKGMKLSELMDKYSLSLYQVRELRKKYELKTR